jgi:hypothetical protein
MLQHAAAWDALVAAAFTSVRSVAQPLWEFVKHNDKDEIGRLLLAAAPPPSCRRNYWQAR